MSYSEKWSTHFPKRCCYVILGNPITQCNQLSKCISPLRCAAQTVIDTQKWDRKRTEFRSTITACPAPTCGNCIVRTFSWIFLFFSLRARYRHVHSSLSSANFPHFTGGDYHTLPLLVGTAIDKAMQNAAYSLEKESVNVVIPAVRLNDNVCTGLQFCDYDR